MEWIVPAPVCAALVVVIEDPLQALKVLLHHDFALLLACFSIDIKADFLHIIFLLGCNRILCINSHEFLDKFTILLLSACINVCLSCQQITLCFVLSRIIVLKCIQVGLTNTVIGNILRTQIGKI